MSIAPITAPAVSNRGPGNKQPLSSPRFGSVSQPPAVDISTLAAKAVPATVAITLKSAATVRPSALNNISNRLNNRWFKNPVPKDVIWAPRIAGTGFWIRCADGKPRILTNAHVVTGSDKDILDRLRKQPHGKKLFKKATVTPVPERDELKCTLNRPNTLYQSIMPSRPTELELRIANIPGTDKQAVSQELDLALVEPKEDSFYRKTGSQLDLPNGALPLELDRRPLDNKPGHALFKVGNSSNNHANIATGVLSAYRRNRREGGEANLHVENTCMLNPGDSGGPLLNMAGRVIGINTWIYYGLQGLGYSLSSVEIRQKLQKWGFL